MKTYKKDHQRNLYDDNRAHFCTLNHLFSFLSFFINQTITTSFSRIKYLITPKTIKCTNGLAHISIGVTSRQGIEKMSTSNIRLSCFQVDGVVKLKIGK